MLFFEKMDFLMKITNSKNSSLARYMTIDASYVSRMRRGDRSMPNNAELIESMAEYFARKSRDGYIKTAILLGMNMNADTRVSEEKMKEYIYSWLTKSDSEEPTGSVNNILSNISNITSGSMPKSSSNDSNLVVYYGTEGKRQATLSLLNLVLASPNAKELLLFSDDNPDLIMENPSFSKTWTELITKLVDRGVHITVIHKITRDINEMLHVINQWLPLYLTGCVDPYYYPHLRDGVYKRTLYVAPALAAVSSSSIGNISDGTANMLATNTRLVEAFTSEFYNYLSLCRPMLKILRNHSITGAILRSFKESAGITVFSAGISHVTIPVFLHKKYLSSDPQNEDSYIEDLESYLMAVGPFLEKYEITCIGYIHSPEEILSGTVKVPLSGILYGHDIYYSAEEYRLHLLNIIYYMEHYSSFSFLLMDKVPFPDIELYVSKDSDAYIIQCGIRSALKIEEASMKSAFYHYITNNSSINPTLSRQETIKILQETAEALKQSEV